MKKIFLILLGIFIFMFLSFCKTKDIKPELYNVTIYNSEGEVFKMYTEVYYAEVYKSTNWHYFDYVFYLKKTLDSTIIVNRYPSSYIICIEQ